MSGKLYVSRSRSVAARKLGDEMLIMSGRDSLGSSGRRESARPDCGREDLPGI